MGGLEGAVGDWRPDLVNKSAENNFLDYNMQFYIRMTLITKTEIAWNSRDQSWTCNELGWSGCRKIET